MQEEEFTQIMQSWHEPLSAINAPLEAWGKRSVNLNDLIWYTRQRTQTELTEGTNQQARFEHIAREIATVYRGQTPFESDPTLREQFQSITREIATVYANANETQRETIRSQIRDLKGVRWQMAIGTNHIHSAADTETFRLALLFESICDGRDDIRDVILALDALCQRAQHVGIEIVGPLEEVAALSSTVSRFPIKDTLHGLLLRQAAKARTPSQR